MQSIGIVVIGRNEGNRLEKCLLSVIGKGTVVYVDSGSTDGSLKLARSLGAYTVELDMSLPFTAARGRNAGFEYLLQLKEVEFVQFVDGDCQIVEGWLQDAVRYLVSYPDVVVVCGHRREEFPTNSIYNSLCEIEWNTPVGEAQACGGDAMMRVSALKKVSGFNSKLIAGEEPELCMRLRHNGGKILRLDAEMTLHDAQITRFGQWWKRSIRSGYGFTEGTLLHSHSPEQLWVKENRRIWFWAVLLPFLTVETLLPTRGLSIMLLLAAYALAAYRVYRYTRLKGFQKKYAFFYALFCIIEKYPQLVGKVQFYISKLLKRQHTIVEYKMPTLS